MDESDTRRRRWSTVLSALIVVRVACAGLFCYAFLRGQRAWPMVILVFATLGDALDGHLARRLGVVPSLGPYADATADFLLVLSAFSAFVIKGVYPLWTLLLIVGMFLQFVWTSGLAEPRYDPLGKYYGVFLFAAIAITLTLPRPAIDDLLLVGIVGFTAASLVSRAVFLLRRPSDTWPES